MYVALLRGLYADYGNTTVEAVRLTSALRPDNASSPHALENRRALDIGSITVSGGWEEGRREVFMRNSGYTIAQDRDPTTGLPRLVGIPINAFPNSLGTNNVGNYTDAPVAGWFLSNVADSYGVNSGQVFHPGKPILNLPTGLSSRVGGMLNFSDIAGLDTQRNMFQHGAGVFSGPARDRMSPHAHFGLYTPWQSNRFSRANSPNYLSPNWGYYEQQRTGVNWI